VFGLHAHGLALAERARAAGVPVVVSPICWYEPRALAALAGGPLSASRDLLKWAIRRAAPRLPDARGRLLRGADRVLPNSQAEADQVARLFGVPRERIRVVPNGVEPRFRQADPGPARAWLGLDEFVLYTGRIEPRKNVLGLVRAMRELPHPLVVIGDPVPGHEGYAHRCRVEAGPRTTWHPRLPHGDPRLASAYAAARVFALPSWFETPGLSALEAALAGAALVLTPFGCTREYFGDAARYADPGRPASIARAVAAAWAEGRQGGLASLIENRYLWAHVAGKTTEVYHELGR
jgi:glycosyltransferase involved in cell wall biosynthesis